MSTISPNMNLIIPAVGSEPGPDWAQDLNADLSILDNHNHSSGQGVAITPGGLNISSDLSFQGNNATVLRSTNFQAQSSSLSLPTDVGCLYVSGVDLYYNDENGNQIRITQSGSVAGSSGTITGLPSGTASASYVSGSQTFVFQSSTNTPANIDGCSFVLRNFLANSKGLTLSPPAAMASDYSLTLPNLPASTKLVTLDSSGNFGASVEPDNSTLEIAANLLQVKNGGITRPKQSAVGQQISSPTGTVTINSTSLTDVTGLTISITTTGRPVMLFFQGNDNTSPQSTIQATWGLTNSFVKIAVLRGITIVSLWKFTQNPPGATQDMSGPNLVLDTPMAGTYTYKVQASVGTVADSVKFDSIKLVAYEL